MGVVIVSGVFIFVLLLFLLIFRGDASSGKRQALKRKEKGETELVPPGEMRPCPICGTMLKRGERVKTVVFPGKPDSMARIYGCPYCYPPSAGVERICPVCRKAVPEEGWVSARMFEGTGKKHIHVLGCTGCRKFG